MEPINSEPGKIEIEPKNRTSILVAEDDSAVLDLLKAIIDPEEFDAEFVQSKDGAIRAIEKAKESGEPKELVLTDKGLIDDKEGGFAVASAAKKCGAKHCILYTASSRADITEQQLKQNGVDALVLKSEGPTFLMKKLNAARLAIINPQPSLA